MAKMGPKGPRDCASAQFGTLEGGGKRLTAQCRWARPMSGLGQTETSARLNGTSALPRTADINRYHRHVGKVPKPEIAVAVKRLPDLYAAPDS